MAVMNAILPLFAIIALGFAAVRSGYVSAEVVKPAGELVIKVALPALIFLALASVPVSAQLNPGFLAGYAAGSLLAFGLCFAIARRGLGMPVTAAAVVGMGASMANSGFMGFPVAQALMGPETAARLLAQCMVVENVLILPLGLALVAWGEAGTLSKAGATWRLVLVGLVRNPLLLALAAGVLASALGVAVPGWGRQALELLARMAAPVALLVIGGMLATLRVERLMAGVAVIAAGKLAIHPLAVWAGLSVAPGVDAALLAGGVLFAAMPMVTIFPLLGARAGYPALSASGLIVATLASFATLAVAIRLLRMA